MSTSPDLVTAGAAAPSSPATPPAAPSRASCGHTPDVDDVEVTPRLCLACRRAADATDNARKRDYPCRDCVAGGWFNGPIRRCPKHVGKPDLA